MALACYGELGGGAEVRLGGDLVQDGRERRDISWRRLVLGGLFDGSDVDDVRWQWFRRRLGRWSELRRALEELLQRNLAVVIDVLHLLFVDRVVFARACEVIVAVVAQDDDLAVLAKLPTSPLAGDAVGLVSPVGVVPSQRIVR